MKKYINTRQVLRDVENGTLTPEEGEKILAEMDKIAQGVESNLHSVAQRLNDMGKGLESNMRKFEEKMDHLLDDLDKKMP